MKQAKNKLNQKRRNKSYSSLKLKKFEAKPSNCGKFVKINLPN